MPAIERARLGGHGRCGTGAQERAGPLPPRRWRGSAHRRVLTALFQSPHAFVMPPFAVCQAVHRHAVAARLAAWIPDGLDAVAGYRESGANGGDTPGGAPPTSCPAPAAVGYPARGRSPASCSPPPARGPWWRATRCAARSWCFHATPTQSRAPGPSLPHSCGACCVSDSAAAVASFFLNTSSTCQRTR